MPSALLRACAEPGCPELVVSGRCQAHQRATEQRRGSAHARGYTRHWRDVFIPHFRRRLIAAGIAPVCGASLPGGPDLSRVSRCRADGRATWVNRDGTNLHLHHEPPLRPDERANRQAVEDPHRVGFLCDACHDAETAGQGISGSRSVQADAPETALAPTTTDRNLKLSGNARACGA